MTIYYCTLNDSWVNSSSLADKTKKNLSTKGTVESVKKFKRKN